MSWMSRKQKAVAISTAEIEYIAISMISCEVAWLQKLLSELFVHMMNTTVILCDNQRGGFNYWGISYSMIAPEDRHQTLPYLEYGKSMSEEAPSHWDWCTSRRHFVKALGKGEICDFPERLGVVERPSYKGPACCMHWALRALGGLGYLLEQHTTTGRLTLPWCCTMYKMTGSTFPCDTLWQLWNKMISSLVDWDD